MLDDASQLSPTPVWKHEAISAPARPEALQQMLAQLRSAASEGRPVIASAARHSMGGQAIAKDGLTITLEQEALTAEPEARTYKVGGGTRWSQVIRTLDPIGFSPAVMQSNHDFGVAATFAVNAHGWAVPWPGCGSTVQSRMLAASGEEIECSRTINPETFSAATGGYGLLGIITEL